MYPNMCWCTPFEISILASEHFMKSPIFCWCRSRYVSLYFPDLIDILVNKHDSHNIPNVLPILRWWPGAKQDETYGQVDGRIHRAAGPALSFWDGKIDMEVSIVMEVPPFKLLVYGESHLEEDDLAVPLWIRTPPYSDHSFIIVFPKEL